MMPRLVVAVIAVLACIAPELRGQEGSLTAFGSDREVTSFLCRLESSPPGRAPAAQHAGPAPAPPRAAVIRGRVTDAEGRPQRAAVVRIQALNVGASTLGDGTYRIVVPRGRMTPGEPVTITAAHPGRAPASCPLVLGPGARLTQNFQLATSATLLVELDGPIVPRSITDTTWANGGDIVKVIGDHLVILRRGRLYTVDVGGGRLRPVDVVDAFAPGADPGGYEMHASGNNVAVIGHSTSYVSGGGRTEINLFCMDAGGRLAYRSTHHLHWKGYVPGFYPSRLVGDQLVLYTRGEAGDPGAPSSWMPDVRRVRPGLDEGEPRPTLRASRIYRPGREVALGDAATLHTVTTCGLDGDGLDGGELDCQSSAVLGPPGRVFYVSPRAVYVWASDWMRPSGRGRAASMLYRLPLDGGAPAALGVEGSPVDQLSFLESDDGHLNVLVRADGTGDGMWGAERSHGTVRLLRVALDRLGDGSTDAPRAAYRDVPQPDGQHASFTNRFVGAHLLYGAGAGWGRPRAGGSTLVAVRWRDGRATELRLPHAVDRIEAMGGDAVVVGADDEDLHFTGIGLSAEPAVGQRYVQQGASQGETHSHGFFYREDGPDEGVIGLPVAGAARPGYKHLIDESAAVLFLRNEDRRFRPLGELFAQVESVDEARDACVTSCADWYGNTRPIFLRGRVFALLGYEIVEGEVAGGRIREVARASFAPRSRSASAK